MFEGLIKPRWYPGNEVWLFLNNLWVPIFALFSVVGVIVLYKTIKQDWSKNVAVPFIVNIVGVVLVPVMTFQLETLIGGFIVTLLLSVSAGMQGYMLWRYSKILTLLCVPYVLWTIPIIVLYIELIRLNRNLQ